jgi:hypothetical protein
MTTRDGITVAYMQFMAEAIISNFYPLWNILEESRKGYMLT